MCFCKIFLGGAQRAPKIDFGRVWGPFESPLGGSFGHVGRFVALLGHLLGPEWSQKRQDEGLKSDLGSSRGGQGSQKLSMGRFWQDFHDLLCASWYFGVFFVLVRFCACSFVP